MGGNPERRRATRILLLIVFLMVLTAAATAVFTAGAVKGQAAAAAAAKARRVEEKAVSVRVSVLAPSDVRDALELPGVLEPWGDYTLAAEQPGRAVAVNVERGQSVAAGELLVAVDRRIYEQEARRTALVLRDATNDLARWSRLQSTGAVSDKDYADIRSRKELAEVGAAEAAVRLSQTEVRSPVAGVVEERFVEPGEYVTPGQPVCRVLDTRRLKLVVSVAEKDAFAVRPRDAVPFRADALPGGAFTGTVASVGAAADGASNTYRVEMSVDNAGGRLKAGLIARVTLARGLRRGVLAVPLGALVPDKGHYVAYVVEGASAVRRVVQVDAIVDSTVVVGGGLRAGDRLVIAGQRQLADGTPVAVEGAEAPAGEAAAAGGGGGTGEGAGGSAGA